MLGSHFWKMTLCTEELETDVLRPLDFSPAPCAEKYKPGRIGTMYPPQPQTLFNKKTTKTSTHGQGVLTSAPDWAILPLPPERFGA